MLYFFILKKEWLKNYLNQHRLHHLVQGLPIWHGHNTAGKVYLVNLAFPPKVFKDVGISFVSPFGAKTYIALHSSE